MTGTPPPLTTRDVAVLIPTKDRPEKLRALLSSLAGQTGRPGRVLVVDGGESVADVVQSFAAELAVEHHPCTPPGQLRQRRHGLAQLDGRTRLVCLLDDDMVLEPGALEAAVAFLNAAGDSVAAVALNVVNEAAHVPSALRRLFFLSGPEPGRVLLSGHNTALTNVPTDTKTQWISGGNTLWRQDILLAHPQEDLRTRWATGEDLRFSYPIGKKYRFFVCAAARARHEHVLDQAPGLEIHGYRARKGALALYHFASAHRELSRLACLWAILSGGLIWLAAGLRHGKPELLRAARGRLGALLPCLRALATGGSVRAELED